VPRAQLRFAGNRARCRAGFLRLLALVNTSTEAITAWLGVHRKPPPPTSTARGRRPSGSHPSRKLLQLPAAELWPQPVRQRRHSDGVSASIGRDRNECRGCCPTMWRKKGPRSPPDDATFKNPKEDPEMWNRPGSDLASRSWRSLLETGCLPARSPLAPPRRSGSQSIGSDTVRWSAGSRGRAAPSNALV